MGMTVAVASANRHRQSRSNLFGNPRNDLTQWTYLTCLREALAKLAMDTGKDRLTVHFSSTLGVFGLFKASYGSGN